jgi:hypothetical protein
MMERMKGHLEEMRKAVSELRENENAVEGAADIEALRKSVLLHLKKLDDLQEAHLRHRARRTCIPSRFAAEEEERPSGRKKIRRPPPPMPAAPN